MKLQFTYWIKYVWLNILRNSLLRSIFNQLDGRSRTYCQTSVLRYLLQFETAYFIDIQNYRIKKSNSLCWKLETELLVRDSLAPEYFTKWWLRFGTNLEKCFFLFCYYENLLKHLDKTNIFLTFACTCMSVFFKSCESKQFTLHPLKSNIVILGQSRYKRVTINATGRVFDTHSRKWNI